MKGLLVVVLCAGVAGCFDIRDGGTPGALQTSSGLAVPSCRAELFARPTSSSLFVGLGGSIELPLGQVDAAVTMQPLVSYQGNSVFLSLEVGADQQCQAMLLVKPTPQSDLMDMIGEMAAIAPDPTDEVMAAEPITNSRNEAVYLLLYGG